MVTGILLKFSIETYRKSLVKVPLRSVTVAIRYLRCLANCQVKPFHAPMIHAPDFLLGARGESFGLQ